MTRKLDYIVKCTRCCMKKKEKENGSQVSRITNNMLLGAIAASTGLWVIGISVTVSYLVITA
jgi:hypothetical protein